VIEGDCLAALPVLAAEGVLLDSVVTDPPYGLKFMGKGWDHGVPGSAFWEAVLAVMKPGAHLLAFGGTRTYHRLACAIEDAGFDIRDCVFWIYGSGFPKSLNVSKAIDKAAGADREMMGDGPFAARKPNGSAGVNSVGLSKTPGAKVTAPATESAKQRDGWGTALKPACEPIVLARKPLSEKTVAANVLAHGTGALNIDGCRIETSDNTVRWSYGEFGYHGRNRGNVETGKHGARWPANVIHDGSDEVMAAFAEFGERNPHDKPRPEKGNRPSGFLNVGSAPGGDAPCGAIYGDTGTAARFFYCAKADAQDRFGSKHPTVKPVNLMRWLVRLITPPGGLILDPFAGTGTTGQAALAEGMRAILIERESEYVADIHKRLAWIAGQGRHSAVERHEGRRVDAPLPLFEP